MSRVSYRPEIDGLRALAVLPVVLFHTRLGFSGGYVGVDVFFVISGFLITALILSDLQAGTFSFAQFWERRIRRIFPAAAVTVLASLAIGYLLLLPSDLADLGESAVAQALLAANIHFYATSGYFSAPADAKPLLHFWSLAVEEQFYLFFPLLLVAVHRWARRWLLHLIGVVALASFALSLQTVRSNPDAAFYLLPSRAWELAAGALLALTGCRLPFPDRWRGPLGWLGFGLITAPMVLYTAKTPFPGAAALPPCLGTVLVIWATAAGGGWLKRLLSFRPAVFIGLISYSLYLWHWPVQVFTHYWLAEGSPFVFRATVAAISLLLGWWSWRYVESPFRTRRALPRRSPLVLATTGVTAVVLSMGLFLSLFNGLPERLPSQSIEYASAFDERPSIEEADVSLEQVEADRLTQLAAGNDGAATILLWGDSHARVVSPAIEVMSEKHHLRAFRASRSMTPSLLDWGSDDVRSHNAAVLRWIERHRPALVILASRWESALSTEADERSLLATIRAVEELGTHVWLMRQVPFQGINVPRALARAALLGQDVAEIGISVEDHAQLTREANAIIDRIAAEDPQLAVLDPVPYLSRDGLCFTELAGEAVYYDRQHLTEFGAKLLEPMFVAALVVLRPVAPQTGTDALDQTRRLAHYVPRPRTHGAGPPTPRQDEAPAEEPFP